MINFTSYSRLFFEDGDHEFINWSHELLVFLKLNPSYFLILLAFAAASSPRSFWTFCLAAYGHSRRSWSQFSRCSVASWRAWASWSGSRWLYYNWFGHSKDCHPLLIVWMRTCWYLLCSFSFGLCSLCSRRQACFPCCFAGRLFSSADSIVASTIMGGSVQVLASCCCPFLLSGIWPSNLFDLEADYQAFGPFEERWPWRRTSARGLIG